jgi:hypothetical protein
MSKLFALLILLSVLVGCASEGPAISKSALGNLEVNVYGPKDAPMYHADIFVDGIFIGNATSNKPVLYLKTGERDVRVELEGYVPYDRKIDVLGDPNHQVLNVFLKPEGAGKKPGTAPGAAE